MHDLFVNKSDVPDAFFMPSGTHQTITRSPDATSAMSIRVFLMWQLSIWFLSPFDQSIKMNIFLRFRLSDLITVICIIFLSVSVIIPPLFCFAGRSREAVCRNNLKLIGVGLELWKEHADCYPFYNSPGLDGNPRNLCPWPDLLAMQNAYTPENIEAQKAKFVQYRLIPDDFIKTIKDPKNFTCPGDQPHPHRINKQRSDAWGFNAYEYSYAMNIFVAPINAQYNISSDKQVLSCDGLWDWAVNFSGRWVTNPNARWDEAGWYCNTVGYWHKKSSANIVFRDLHVENHKYPPDTVKIYFLKSGESLDGVQ